jgi:hypothetical protein
VPALSRASDAFRVAVPGDTRPPQTPRPPQTTRQRPHAGLHASAYMLRRPASSCRAMSPACPPAVPCPPHVLLPCAARLSGAYIRTCSTLLARVHVCVNAQACARVCICALLVRVDAQERDSRVQRLVRAEARACRGEARVEARACRGATRACRGEHTRTARRVWGDSPAHGLHGRLRGGHLPTWRGRYAGPL